MRTHTILSAGLAAGLCLLAIQPSGCLAPDGKLDVPATVVELNLTADDLDTLATVAEGGTAKALQDTAGAIRQAATVLGQGGPPGDAWSLLDASLDALAAVAEKEEDSDLALAVAAARIIVGRIKASLPEPTD